jgi:hypothetical protein
VDGALQILLVISSPTDLPPIDVEKEARRIDDALSTNIFHGKVSVERFASSRKCPNFPRTIKGGHIQPTLAAGYAQHASDQRSSAPRGLDICRRPRQIRTCGARLSREEDCSGAAHDEQRLSP